MTKPSAIARQWDFDQSIAALTINGQGDVVAAALGDGSFRIFPAREQAKDPQIMAAHDGVSLSLVADADGAGFLSGGDDGQVLLIDPALAAPTLLVEHKGKWIDHVAASPEGWRAYSLGKQAVLVNAEGKAQKPFDHPSSVGGLAFAPNGKRLAVSHYNGVSLWWTNSKEQTPVKLIWKGSHLNLIWSPDSKILISSMQEGALHGWRMADSAEMQMQGYATKIRSMAFTPKGKYLATSGANEAICWPFFGGGPWGKTPLTLGGYGDPAQPSLVTVVAPHPKDEMMAIGYDNGAILLAPLDGRMEMMVHIPVHSSVVGLVWNAAGDCLFAALERGSLLLFTIDSVRRSVAYA